MSGKKGLIVLAGVVFSVSLIAVSATSMFLTDYYSHAHIEALGGICRKMIEKQPEAEQTVLEAIKEYKYGSSVLPEENIILIYGYRPSDLWNPSGMHRTFFLVVGFLAGVLLFFITCLFWRQKEIVRIKMLTGYLEKVNMGYCGTFLQTGEDDFSKLQDEIYKTVTELHQTRDAAVQAKNNFADNLYNIAHQIKTPVTSISLSVQMMQDNPSPIHLEQIRRQISHMIHLEDALLLLSRIDAGTLSLKREDVDVFTILMLAADNLQEMLLRADVFVDIPESGEMLIRADMEWTMEAIMNILKDCMEHTPSGGTVYCSYEQNPLYTQIRIWDTGDGFAKEDIPHLFERFYRGRKMKGDGIGIGLALSKAIIEEQNGTITARNLINAGACFEIRFYSH